MKTLITAFSMILVSNLMLAQTATEAIRYSNNEIGGTARANSMGNAFGALAADFTGVNINPAILGTYRSSEIGITVGIHSFKTSSYFNDNSINNGTQRFNLPNMHMVTTAEFNDGPLKYSNWSIGYNKRNYYHSRSSFIGTIKNSSIIDQFLTDLNQGNGTSWDNIVSDHPFTNALAWEGYLINNVSDIDTTHFVGIYDGGAEAAGIRTVKGSQSDFLISYGANFYNKLFLGLSIGIPSLRYNYVNVYSERDQEELVDDFIDFTITEEVSSIASGIYLQAGLIYQVNPFIRLGSSYKTSTAFYFEDEYESGIVSNFESGNYSYDSPEGRFDYVLYTPSKWTNSFAFIHPKGLISVDVDWIDYSTANYDLGNNSSNPDDWFYGMSVNNQINANFRSVFNYRLGGELRIAEFDDGYQSLRMGLAYYASPYDAAPSTLSADYAKTVYAIGTGFRYEYFFIDLALSTSYTESVNDLYELETKLNPSVKRVFEHSQALLTIGWRY